MFLPFGRLHESLWLGTPRFPLGIFAGEGSWLFGGSCSCLLYLFQFGWLLVEDSFVVRADDCFDVWHTAVAKFDCISVENLVQRVVGWEALVKIFKNFCPMLVVTLQLYRGLKKMIFRLFLRFPWFTGCALYVSWWW